MRQALQPLHVFVFVLFFVDEVLVVQFFLNLVDNGAGRVELVVRLLGEGVVINGLCRGDAARLAGQRLARSGLRKIVVELVVWRAF